MTTAERLAAFWENRRSLGDPNRLWFDQQGVALLLSERVDDVIERCRSGQLEARWIGQPDGSRDWYVFETAMVRWIEHGPIRLMGFDAAMGRVAEGEAVRRVAWNDLAHVTGWLEGDVLYALKWAYILDYDERRSSAWEAAEEDKRAADWVEHDAHAVLYPPPLP